MLKVKLFSRNLLDNSVITLHHKRVLAERRVNPMHAHRGGGSVLRGESSWRTVCGVAVALRHRTVLVQWRGFHRA